MTSNPLGQGVTGLTLDLLAERIEREREVREAHETATEKARQIQFDEYERRLTTLNHAHEAAVEAQRSTVPREVYEAFLKENDQRREALVSATNIRIAGVEAQIEVERNARIRSEGALGTWRAIATFLGASGLIGIVLGLIAVFGPKT